MRAQFIPSTSHATKGFCNQLSTSVQLLYGMSSFVVCLLIVLLLLFSLLSYVFHCHVIYRELLKGNNGETSASGGDRTLIDIFP